MEVYADVSRAQTARWEQKLKERLVAAQDNPGAFELWSNEVLESLLAVLKNALPQGMPIPRGTDDALLDNEAVRAVHEAHYRERQLLKKVRTARRQYLPEQDPDALDRALQEVLEKSDPMTLTEAMLRQRDA